MIPTWSPPTIISPRRLALSAHVRAAVEKLRPDVVVLPDAGFGELAAGVAAYHPVCECGRPSPTDTTLCGICVGGMTASPVMPRLIVSEPDPALRAVWLAAQRGELTTQAHEAAGCWRDSVKDYGADAAWDLLVEPASEFGEAACAKTGHVAAWAIAVAAGAQAWSRNANGHFNAPLAPGELTERIFPAWWPSVVGPGVSIALVKQSEQFPRTPQARAEAVDAWAREHVAHVGDDAETAAFGALAVRGAGMLVVLDLVDVEAAKRIAARAIKNGGAALCFARDATIDDWVLPDGETVRVGPRAPRWGGGLTFTRLDSGDWVGRSFGP